MLSYGILIVISAMVIGFLSGLISSIHFMFDKPFNQLYELISWKTIKVVSVSMAASYSVNAVSYFQPHEMFTPVVHSFEGTTVAIFQTFTHPALTIFFILVYMIVYPVLLFLTYLKLHSLENEPELNYVGSYVLIILLSAPFFYFIPVEVTGYYHDAIQPILYEYHPFIRDFFTSFDPLTKAVPSLHTGLSVLAFVYSFKYTETYRWYAGAATAAIIISTFYLGIHWITDAVVGAIMALTTFYLVDKGYIDSSIVPNRIKSGVKRKLDSLDVNQFSDF